MNNIKRYQWLHVFGLLTLSRLGERCGVVQCMSVHGKPIVPVFEGIGGLLSRITCKSTNRGSLTRTEVSCAYPDKNHVFVIHDDTALELSRLEILGTPRRRREG